MDGPGPSPSIVSRTFQGVTEVPVSVDSVSSPRPGRTPTERSKTSKKSSDRGRLEGWRKVVTVRFVEPLSLPVGVVPVSTFGSIPRVLEPRRRNRPVGTCPVTEKREVRGDGEPLGSLVDTRSGTVSQVRISGLRVSGKRVPVQLSKPFSTPRTSVRFDTRVGWRRGVYGYSDKG